MSAAEASPLPTLASSNVITPDNHGAYVTITASLMLVSMVLLTGLRLSIRYPFTQLFGLDDAAIVISAICAIAQTVAILEAVKAGLGRHVLSLSDDMRETAQKVHSPPR
ncbi:hypothetical protein AC579_7044 [Neofusicoccum parvum]|nr:hypothetical protein AC579_7044 [Neofusicoccum parvum]